ncbi:MAG TPA: HAD family hydrolase [Anaerolineales bacterium]|nr:HAD family hydrolase [Anaerolineales bacterium]
MIKNILWAVDGVLFDTYPAITYAISRSLNDLGLPVALNEIDALTRQSIDHCLATLSRRFKLDPGLLRLRFDESCLKVPPERQPPFPGARDVCALIHRRGRNIIATHRSIDFARQLLRTHGFAKYFAGIVSVTEGYAHKPDPALFEAALQRFNLEKKNTLIIGSRAIDMQAGRAAGLTTCLFDSAHVSEPVDHHFNNFSQFLDWLRSQR